MTTVTLLFHIAAATVGTVKRAATVGLRVLIGPIGAGVILLWTVGAGFALLRTICLGITWPRGALLSALPAGWSAISAGIGSIAAVSRALGFARGSAARIATLELVSSTGVDLLAS